MVTAITDAKDSGLKGIIRGVFKSEELKKSAKLAAEAEPLDGHLIRLFYEPDDSGIDSDETTNTRRDRLEHQSESSSDEELMIRPWWPVQKTKNDEQKAMKNGPLDPMDITWPDQNDKRKSLDSLDRSSPPLYEVELTASDEDDDASVLELVIPMQSSRYQRVPTSSPKKTKSKSRRLLYVFCCMRK